MADGLNVQHEITIEIQPADPNVPGDHVRFLVHGSLTNLAPNGVRMMLYDWTQTPLVLPDDLGSVIDPARLVDFAYQLWELVGKFLRIPSP